MTSQPNPHGMTAAQRDFLISSGAMTVEQVEKAETNVANGKLVALAQQTKNEAIADTYSSREVAHRLKVDESSSQLEGLYRFTHNHTACYPTWQFTEDANQPLLPGLRQLVASISSETHPASVRGFMATPQENLHIEGQAITPTEWLRQGNDVQNVIDILKSFLA